MAQEVVGNAAGPVAVYGYPCHGFWFFSLLSYAKVWFFLGENLSCFQWLFFVVPADGNFVKDWSTGIRCYFSFPGTGKTSLAAIVFVGYF